MADDLTLPEDAGSKRLHPVAVPFYRFEDHSRAYVAEHKGSGYLKRDEPGFIGPDNHRRQRP